MNSYKKFKGVFFNKLDIDNFDVLNKEEYKITSNRSDEILSGQVVLNNKNYGIEKLKAIHNHLFQDVYEWAGKIRTTPSSKTTNSIRTEFEIPSNILKSWELLENKTSTFVSKTDDNFNRKVEELSNIFVEANRIHPFPEGNGRTLQIFIKELAKEQKINLDFNKVNAAEWNMASAVSGKHGRLFDFAKENLPPPNPEPIKNIFLEISSQIIEPIPHVDFKNEVHNQVQD
jgi:cell filamentation protein